MSSYSFGKPLRLLKSAEFQAVFNNAPLRASHKNLLILAKPTNLDAPRLGLVIGKKNIRLSVQRNRVKRIIRETFRHQQEHLVGLDVIVLARGGLDGFNNLAMAVELNKQWRRIIRKQVKAQDTIEI